MELVYIICGAVLLLLVVGITVFAACVKDETDRRKTRKTTDNEGLKVKYNVYKTSDGSVVNNCFVLRPDKDPAAREALHMYAMCTENQALSKDIRKWLRSIEKDLKI